MIYAKDNHYFMSPGFSANNQQRSNTYVAYSFDHRYINWLQRLFILCSVVCLLTTPPILWHTIYSSSNSLNVPDYDLPILLLIINGLTFVTIVVAINVLKSGKVKVDISSCRKETKASKTSYIYCILYGFNMMVLSFTMFNMSTALSYSGLELSGNIIVGTLWSYVLFFGLYKYMKWTT